MRNEKPDYLRAEVYHPTDEHVDLVVAATLYLLEVGSMDIDTSEAFEEEYKSPRVRKDANTLKWRVRNTIELRKEVPSSEGIEEREIMASVFRDFRDQCREQYVPTEISGPKPMPKEYWDRRVEELRGVNIERAQQLDFAGSTVLRAEIEEGRVFYDSED